MKFLIVDDDPCMRMCMVRCAQAFTDQADIVEAEDGETAIALVEGNTFDVIFTDFDYKNRTNGLDFVRRVHARGNPPPILMMSGSPFVGEDLAALKLPRTSFFPKPFSREQVLGWLKQQF